MQVSLKDNKWVICCSYNPNRTFVSDHLDHIAKGINTCSKKYKKKLLMGILKLRLQKLIWQLSAMNINLRL